MNNLQLNRASRALLLSNIMVGLEGTIIATALPSMMADLHGIQFMSWIIAIYMLLMAVSAPIWTKLSERFGYKRLIIIGTFLFILSSLIEGLSLSMPMLIAARALMGIGAGAMQQLPFVIYGVLFDPARRRKATGNAISAYSLAAIIGPLIGGVIVSTLGWRWVFFINIPIGILMILAIKRNFFHKFIPNIKTIDYAGSTLLSTTVISLMLALQFTGNSSPNWTVIFFLLILSLLSGLLFIFIEKHATDPVIPLALFKNHALMSKNLMMFLQYGFFGFYNNYLPTWAQGPLGTSALIGGLILVPSSIFIIFGTQTVARLTQFLSEKAIATIGFILMLLGDGILLTRPLHTSLFWLLLSAGLLGLASGWLTVLQIAVQEVVPADQIGAATALNALIRTLGTTLILSGLSVSLNLTFDHAISQNHQLSFTLINKISDSTALKHISQTLVEPLRQVLYNGLHSLSLIAFFILLLAFFINLADSWKRL